MSKARREQHKLQVRAKTKRKRLEKVFQRLKRTVFKERSYVLRDPVPISKMRALMKEDTDIAFNHLMSNSRPPKMHIKSKYRWAKHVPDFSKAPDEAPLTIPMSEALCNFSLKSKLEVGILFDGIPLHLVNMYRVKLEHSREIDGTNQMYAVYIAHHGRGGMLRDEAVGNAGDQVHSWSFDTGYIAQLKQEQKKGFQREPGIQMLGCGCGGYYNYIQSDHIVTILRVINGTPVAEGPFKGMCEVHYMTVPHLASHASVASAYAWTYGMGRSTLAIRKANQQLIRT